MSEYSPKAQQLMREIRHKALRNLERSGEYTVDLEQGTYKRKSRDEVKRRKPDRTLDKSA